MTARRALVVARVAAVAVVGVVGTACGGGRSTSLRSTTSTSTTSSTTSTTAVALSSRQVLERMSVAPGDVGPGMSVDLMQGGDRVSDQVSLDVCGADFPSEALRVYRRQVNVVQGEGSPLSSEALLYGSERGTVQAFAELRSAEANCPKGYVDSPVANSPDYKTTFRPSPDATWAAVPGVERLVFDFDATERGGSTHRFVAVYLRRDKALLGIYWRDPAKPPAIAGSRRSRASSRSSKSGWPTCPPRLSISASRLASPRSPARWRRSTRRPR